MPGDWLKLYRKLRKSAAWNTGEPFTRGQAWVDLLMAANYTDNTLFVRGVAVPIKRGQVGESTVTLSSKWNRSRGWVIRFLSWLESEQQIVHQKNNVTSIITILNYDDYQAVGTADDTASDTANGTADGQQIEQQTGATKKDNKANKDNKGKKTPLPPLPHSLGSGEMLTAWDDWVRHRAEIRKPLTTTQAAKQVSQFEKWGEPRAIAAIEHTIRMGWQGLREPEQGGNGQPEKPKFTMLSDLDDE